MEKEGKLEKKPKKPNKQNQRNKQKTKREDGAKGQRTLAEIKKKTFFCGLSKSYEN